VTAEQQAGPLQAQDTPSTHDVRPSKRRGKGEVLLRASRSLSSEQQKVVDADCLQHRVLIAVAGSGKTEVLVQAALKAFAKCADPDQGVFRDWGNQKSDTRLQPTGNTWLTT
jgi:hypothetical protein